MKPLIAQLDEARGHTGEPDEMSRRLMRAAHDWAVERLTQGDVEQALSEGTVRVYLNPDGTTETVEYGPGFEAAVAAFNSP